MKTTRTTTVEAGDTTAMDAMAAATDTMARDTTAADSLGAAVTTTVVTVAAAADSACDARHRRAGQLRSGG